MILDWFAENFWTIVLLIGFYMLVIRPILSSWREIRSDIAEIRRAVTRGR